MKQEMEELKKSDSAVQDRRKRLVPKLLTDRVNTFHDSLRKKIKPEERYCIWLHDYVSSQGFFSCLVLVAPTTKM